MSVRTTISNGVRSWLKDAAGLTDEQCYREPFRGTRPPSPALGVQVTVHGIEEGQPEHVDGIAGGLPTRVARTHERGTVTVRAYGDTAVDWLEDAVRGLTLDAAQAVLDSAGISISPMGGLRDVSALLETSIEIRAVREFEVTYAADSDTATGIEATTFETEVTGESAGHADLTETFTAP